MPVNAADGAALEAELAHFRVLATEAGIALGPLVEPTLPDSVLDEDCEEPLEDMVQAMVDDGAQEAWVAETRFDDSVLEDDDRLEDHLARQRVERGSLLSFAVYWKAGGGICAWDVSTRAYSDALDLIVDDPDGVIHVDEDFIARMHAERDAREAEMRAHRILAEKHGPYFEDLILNDPIYRGLPRRERMARAREILKQAPTTDDTRYGRFGAADRAYRRADAAVRAQIAGLHLGDAGKAFAEWPGWDPAAPADEQREQAQAYLMEHHTQGWRVHKATADKLLAVARRAQEAAH